LRPFPNISPAVRLLLLGMTAACTLQSAPRLSVAAEARLGTQENGCIRAALSFFRADCSYEYAHPTLDDQPVPWLGPTAEAVYYEQNDAAHGPTVAPRVSDSRRAPSLEADLRRDDRGTADPADDQFSGSLRVGPAARSVSSRTSGAVRLSRVVERWRAVRHEMSSASVTSARLDADGGITYTIASLGFPKRLCARLDPTDCFPSGNAAGTSEGKWGAGFWAPTMTAPIGRSPALGGNVGARTVATFEDYRCEDNASGAECAQGITVWGAREDPGWDNLLLLIRTDQRGKVRGVAGYWTQEYRLGQARPDLITPIDQDDSWMGGYFELGKIDP
jgi:hypothetical protein